MGQLGCEPRLLDEHRDEGLVSASSGLRTFSACSLLKPPGPLRRCEVDVPHATARQLGDEVVLA